MYHDKTVKLLDIFQWRDIFFHLFQNDSWPTQTLDRQVPGMELAGPLHLLLNVMMLPGLIPRIIYKHAPAGSDAVARVLPLSVAYIENGTRKLGSHVVCNTDTVWGRMNDMLHEN